GRRKGEQSPCRQGRHSQLGLGRLIAIRQEGSRQQMQRGVEGVGHLERKGTAQTIARSKVSGLGERSRVPCAQRVLSSGNRGEQILPLPEFAKIRLLLDASVSGSGPPANGTGITGRDF